MILKIILYNTQYFFSFLVREREKMKSYKRVTIELRDIRDDRILTRFPTLCRTLLLHVHTMWNRIAPICPHSNEPLIDVCTQQRRNQDLSVKFISRWLDQRPRGVLTSKRWLKIDFANCAKKRADGSKFQFWVWNELKIYAIKKVVWARGADNHREHEENSLGTKESEQRCEVELNDLAWEREKSEKRETEKTISISFLLHWRDPSRAAIRRDELKEMACRHENHELAIVQPLF